MIPELGHFALILATLVALILGTLPLLGAHRNRMAWVALARPAATAMALLITFSFACLTQAFVVSDFSVVYVAQHSNSLLPIQYRVAAVWGGHEGSLLLWMLMLSWWAFAVAMLSRQLPETMVARVLGTLGLVAFGFLLFILITSNPFERLLPAAAEGKRSESAAAGLRPGHPSADALHGLRRLLGRLCLRHRRPALRPARRRLGALVATVDDWPPGSS